VEPTAAEALASRACARHGLTLEGLLPGRATASVFVARVRTGAGERLVLKRPAPALCAGEIAVVRVWSGMGVGPRLVGEPEPGLYLAEWIDGTPLAALADPGPAAGAAIGRVLRRLHALPPPDGLAHARDQLGPGRSSEWTALPAEMRALAESLADVVRARHPAADMLLHGDLVPSNLLVTGAEPRLIDPVGLRGPAAWDLAQLAVAAEGRGQRGLLGPLVAGYGRSPPLLAEMSAWMLLFYLAKNLAQPGSPFASRLRRLADALVALGDPRSFAERHLL
jgi:hypothetical protein